MKKFLSAFLAASMVVAALPIVQAGAVNETAPYRAVRWDESTLTDNQISPVGWAYNNENFITEYNPGEYSTAGKGLTADGKRINYGYAVKGLFGKASDDISVNMHTENAIPNASGSENNREVYQPRYLFENHQKGNAYNLFARPNKNGGYTRFSFDISMTEEVNDIRFQAVNPDAANTKDIVRTTNTSLAFLDGTSVNYDKPLQSAKWYHFEIVLRSGTAEDETAHEAWVYVDGKLMLNKAFTWTNNNNQAIKIERLNQYNLGFVTTGSATTSIFPERNMYFDNVYFEYWNAVPENAPIRSGNVDLSTSLSSIEARETSGAYAGIDPSITVAQYKAALNNKNLTAVVRDKNGNTVDDNASLAGNGNFIALTDTDNVTYYKKAYTDRVIYDNAFDDGKTDINGAPTGGLWGINQFNTASYPAFTTSTEASIGGKSVYDKSYLLDINNFIGGGDGSGKFFQLVPITPISASIDDDKLVFETSIFYPDANINRTFTVSTNAGTVSIATFAGNSTKFRIMKSNTGASSENYDINTLTLNAWHTYKMIFTQGGKDVLVYVDGTKLEYTGDKAFAESFTDISKIRYTFGVNAATSENPLLSKSYLDDIRISQKNASYVPETGAVASNVYAVNDADGTIMIQGAVSRSDFDKNILTDGYYTVFDDESKTSTSMSALIVQEGAVVVAKSASGLIKEYKVIGVPVYASNTFDAADDDNSLTNFAPNGGWACMKLNSTDYPGHTAAIAPAAGGRLADNSCYKITAENFVGGKNDKGDNLYDPFYHYNNVATGISNGSFVYSTDIMLGDKNGTRQTAFNVNDGSENSTFYININRGSSQVKVYSYENKAVATSDIDVNRWYRITVVIPYGANTVSVYINGELIADNIAVTALTNGMKNITRVKVSVDYGPREEDNPANSFTCYDNIKYYQSLEGYSEETPSVSGNAMTGNEINLIAPTTAAELMSGLQFTNAARKTIYKDSTFTATAADTDVLKDGACLVVESEDGILKYYNINGECTLSGLTAGYGENSANASINVSNLSDKAAEGSLILCAYNGTELKKVAFTDFSVKSGETKDITSTLTGIDNTLTLKAFVWDSADGMKPLADAYTK